MRKCEWKDGKVINSEGDHRLRFKPCSEMNMKIYREGKVFLKTYDDQRERVTSNGTIFLYCPWCGADIRKPEPEKSLIVKSGGTWVGYDNDGVNYIWVGRKSDIDYVTNAFKNIGNCNSLDLAWMNWKSFENSDGTEITLDDEIIKLWPVCIFDNSGYLTERKAQVVFYNRAILNKYIDSFGVKWDHCQLATPKELQELS